jgi:hypothetical protein
MQDYLQAKLDADPDRLIHLPVNYREISRLNEGRLTTPHWIPPLLQSTHDRVVALSKAAADTIKTMQHKAYAVQQWELRCAAALKLGFTIPTQATLPNTPAWELVLKLYDELTKDTELERYLKYANLLHNNPYNTEPMLKILKLFI